MYRIIFILPLAVVLCGQQVPTAQQAEKKGSISGTILNAMTKDPVRKAEVILMRRGGPVPMTGAQPGLGGGQGGQMGPSASNFRGQPGSFGSQGSGRGSKTSTTDADGKFTFTDLDVGSYVLISRRTGLIDTRYGARTMNGMGTSITVSEGQEVKSIRVEMLPQGVVAGRVLDEDGEILQGVQVQLINTKVFTTANSQMARVSRGMRMFGGMSRTDDRGEFRIANVSPGSYLLQVSPQNGRMTDEAGTNRAYVTTYFPGVYDSSAAEKITVTPGAELSGFQVRLQKTEVYSVKGSLVNPEGQVPPGYSIYLMPKGKVSTMTPTAFRRQNDGGFELQNVLPGSYTLIARAQNGPRNALMHREDLNVGAGNVENLAIRMAAPLTVTGQVLVGKDAAAGASPTNMRISLIPFDAPGGPGVQAKEDGTFVMENISPGSYRVMVAMPSSTAYLESVRFGEQDVTGREIEITSSAPLQVRIDANGGTVTGTITTDGNPALGSTIVLVPVKKELRDSPFLKTIATDQNGSFTISNIAPGDYLVFGVEEYDESALDDENQMQNLERKAKKVSLKKGGSESVALELIRTDS